MLDKIDKMPDKTDKETQKYQICQLGMLIGKFSQSSCIAPSLLQPIDLLLRQVALPEGVSTKKE